MQTLKETPMIKQYKRIKKGIPGGCILMFRMGDFYEMFFEDAKTAAGVLNIALTRRSREEGRNYPMCGIPYHAAEAYIGKLIKAGYKVAVCDQMEDPKLAKGIVRRDVTRVVTPGTVLDTQLLDAKKNNFLVSVNKMGNVYGISCVDVSTGEFRVTELGAEADFISEFTRIAPAECIVPAGADGILQGADKNGGVMLNKCDDWIFDYDNCYSLLKEHFKTESLDGFGCRGMVPGVTAAGALLYYLKENLRGPAEHIKRIVPYTTGRYMALDAATIRNLELIEPMHGGDKALTLFAVLDYTRTGMGGRLLMKWIKQPLVDVEEIKERMSAVMLLCGDNARREGLIRILKDIPDMERIAARISTGYAGARDVAALKNAMARIPDIKGLIKETGNRFFDKIHSCMAEFDELVSELDRAIVDDPPPGLREGGFIKDGFNPELDGLRSISKEAKGWISGLQAREAERTGIKSLKVRYNKVFGYYIEISRANLRAVPEDYTRKQTLVNAERFITPELKEYESRVLNAKEEICRLEYRIFTELKDKINAVTADIQADASLTASVDVLCGFAECCRRNRYIFPEINDGMVIDIKAGRHPVVESHPENGKRFVPNDILLDSADNQLVIITGPNMAGKSTYIRQAALLVLMAQTGCGIPADRAVIGVVDRIFTRVGAGDDISRGQSTFMVEMNETAYILNNATEKSFIVLDEIGRGTSTFDGISIAWAVAEYLSGGRSGREGCAGPKTLFATHYHELTKLADIYPNVKNYNIAVREWNDEIVFLYKILPGSTDKSYGIHVARLAGLPASVLDRAKEIINKLEDGSFIKEGVRRKDPRQMYLFDMSKGRIADKIRGIKLDYITPVEALNKLKELKEML